MKARPYSYTLVILQFLCVIALIAQAHTLFNAIIPLIVFGMGASVGVYAILHNQIHNFNILPEIKQGAQLITTGAYAYVRHPMYFSVLMMMLAFVLSNPTLIAFFTYGILLIVLFLKARKEEHLWLEKSTDYAIYKAKTKYIIPFLL